VGFAICKVLVYWRIEGLVTNLTQDTQSLYPMLANETGCPVED